VTAAEYRVVVVAHDPERDRTSAQLLAARHPRAAIRCLDTGTLRLEAGAGVAWSTTGSEPLEADALIVRRFSPLASAQAQFELLELLERQGTLVVNSTRALSLSESKLQTTAALAQAGIPVPPTLVTHDVDDARAAVSEFGRAVLKPLYGELGEGVERVEEDVDPELLAERLEAHGVLYVQQYLPNDGTDVRAFVVGNRVVAAMRRVAAPGEWRSNIHQGGVGQPVELPPATEQLAVRAAEALGLDYSGVDLIEGPAGPVVVECNGTPGWLELKSATGCDIAAAIVEHVVDRLDRR